MVLAVFGALLVGGAIFYFVFSTQSAAEQMAAEERLGLSLQEDKQKKILPFYIAATSFFLREPYVSIPTQFWGPLRLEKVKRRLVAAGLGQRVSPEQFVASKFFLTLYIIAFFLVMTAVGSPPARFMIVALLLFGFFLADLHLSGARKIRQQEIRIAMPYIIDLLTLCMEAGLDFMGAVGKVIEKAPHSAFIEELSTVLKDIQLGKTRAKALKDMSYRIDMLEITSLVAVVVSADQMGSSVGTALRGQSDLLRNARLMKAEEEGAKASQKIMFPLVFIILPAVFLIIMAPVALQMFGGGK